MLCTRHCRLLYYSDLQIKYQITEQNNCTHYTGITNVNISLLIKFIWKLIHYNVTSYNPQTPAPECWLLCGLVFEIKGIIMIFTQVILTVHEFTLHIAKAQIDFYSPGDKFYCTTEYCQSTQLKIPVEQSINPSFTTGIYV